MAKYLRKFGTSAAYNAAKSTLVKPNVSYIVETNGVEFKPYVPPQPIRYTASAKLSETTNINSSGLHTNAFNTTIKSHTFENGVGTIEFDGDVTSIGERAFNTCTNLISVTIPDSVTIIGSNAFNSCSGLTSITIPDGVTSIGNSAFWNCSGLTNITIPDSVTSIGQSAFYSCSGLTSVTIPDNVTSIGMSAFSYCTGLTSIIIPSSVTNIAGNAFMGCTGLTSIVVDSANTVYDSRNNCNAIIKTSTNELITGYKNTIIPNSVTIIGSNAFMGCSGLTSVTIPDSVTRIRDYAFKACSGLTGITIPSSVTRIDDEAFRSCSSLTNITSLRKTAPTIKYNTFQEVKTNGTLTVPTGSTGYDVWMGTGNYYLGKYSWTKVEQ